MHARSTSPKWRTLSIEKTLRLLGVDATHGLAPSDAAARKKTHGPNSIPEPQRRSVVALWIKQFYSPLITVLVGAGAVMLVVEHYSDAIVIFAVLLINSFIGTFHEVRAQKTVDALKKLSPHETVVCRGGAARTIHTEDVVPGDILVIHAGDRIVADARLLETYFLRVNESLLTGESLPAPKDAAAKPNSRDALDAPTMVFAGTIVTHGSARAVVVETGTHTQHGSISARIRATRTATPLERDMRMVSRFIVGMVAVLLIIIIAAARARGIGIFEILFFAIAIATSAIPEGLPIVISFVLTSGMWHMARRGALVKKLFAVEALGQVRVLALEKTGTLTLNRMVVMDVRAADHARVATLLPAIVNKEHTNDPTEMAFLVHAQKLFPNATPDALALHPFNYEKKIALAARPHTDEAFEVVLAGVPETVLAACTLAPHEHGALAAELDEMAARGLRVVALATKKFAHGGRDPEAALSHLAHTPQDFVFEAFLGLADEIRPEAAQVIARAKSAGLKVVMVTGDLPTTARAVAHAVGLYERGDHILTGAELHALPEKELRALLPRVSIFARVTPEDKVRIVELYQAAGMTVAMTGDDVSDAASLVKADVGIAMGHSGTDVARHAADIILLHESLEPLVAAIDEGRAMYVTLRKVLVYLFATNFGEICTITTALLVGLPVPLLAVQIIWMNVVTDGFLDVSLTMEPREDGLIPKPRRAKYFLLPQDFVSILVTGALMTAGTLYMFWRYAPFGVDVQRSVALLTLVMFQWMHAWMMRTERRSIFSISIFRNPYLVGATGFVIALQVCAVYIPFMQHLLHTAAVPALGWLEAFGFTLVVLCIEEARKFARRRGIKM